MKQDMTQRFIDIHTHILQGMDDGAQDLQQSLDLIRMAWENGTGAVVLTPHYRGRYRKNTPQQMEDALKVLRGQVEKNCPEMKFYLGNEACWERELPDKLSEGRALTLNGTRYVLLEFQFRSPRSQVMDGVLEMVNCGYVPIIAHVERYEIFHKLPTLADEVLEIGALLQLNADSVMGAQGFGIKRFCHRLLKKQKVHFVASDAHDIHDRTPLLNDCFRRISKKYGEDYARALFWENAEMMLADE